MGVYKFVEENSIVYITNIVGRTFENDWIKVCNNGKIIVNPKKLGYAWDGCSPKFKWKDLLLGAPDGAIDINTNKPYTYYASLIHDAIYQFKHEIPISKKEADKIFHEILLNNKFYWSNLYYLILICFGKLYGKWFYKKNKLNKIIVKIKYH